jgi:hypothetical protein
LVGLIMFGAMLFASAASAQATHPAAGNTGPYGCPEEAPYVATLPGDPGEGSLLCFPTQAQARAYSTTGQVPQGATDDTATATPTATSTATAPPTSTLTAPPTSTASGTPTATARGTATASANDQETQQEEEQDASEQREERQDEPTTSEDSQAQTRSVKQTLLPGTGGRSNSYPITLTVITVIGLAISGLLAVRAIRP